MSEGPMTSGWFYLKSGKPSEEKVGPLTWEELWAAGQSGALGPSDFVWQASLPEWVLATRVAGLFPGAGAKVKKPKNAPSAAEARGVRRRPGSVSAPIAK